MSKALICYGDNGTEVYPHITKAAAEVLNLTGAGVCEFLAMDRDGIKRLNLVSREIDSATDVLSFPSLSGDIKPFTKANYPCEFDPNLKAVVIGSIVICASVAAEQAREYGHSPEREESYLFVHGLLHLLGYDHESDADKIIMRKAEEEILSAAEEKKAKLKGIKKRYEKIF
jgi:probable rRNA maturation factor